MLKVIKQHIGLMLVVILSAALSIVLTVFRWIIAEAIVYDFLLWNLFLAFIPFVISLVVYKSTSKTIVLILSLFWLLFFPNAPYLITDLFHYRYVPPVPRGFDMALLVSYAWNGLVLGHLSILFIHEGIARLLNNFVAWSFVFLSLLAGAFGVYLGRMLRWNSWDVLFDKEALFFDIQNIISNPQENGLAWAITALTFAFLLIGYLFIRQLVNFGKSQTKRENYAETFQ